MKIKVEDKTGKIHEIDTKDIPDNIYAKALTIGIRQMYAEGEIGIGIRPDTQVRYKLRA